MRDSYTGWVKKFTIRGDPEIDCYLQIGTVGPENVSQYPHLSIGDICFLDITLSKQGDYLRVYSVLMDMANHLIKSGGNIAEIVNILKYNQFEPSGVTNDENIPICSSICDFIGKYLEEKS